VIAAAEQQLTKPALGRAPWKPYISEETRRRQKERQRLFDQARKSGAHRSNASPTWAACRVKGVEVWLVRLG
jgi:hypothetical protein